ncbi:LysR substrate-binding domain-containing protein [Vitiosangium sp. GDMCC 1.1324]|uniref:LysR substrate-binding domain-containing protein n=1 Tax=Vitiosangium sp. (strain GDMCC 1.1324) TaxID=2138576 RepID=UPI000D3C032E|nr:LysR substrate-binding domain-containing protein [Vitiosangium sp. GDMCC 1.1324]PTL79360.1 LysR family transcriptional regulator [Vitiosangium sp. GDMCC 1.1324]
MLNLNDLALFVAAIEHGGFAAAARRLGVPKATISKRVAELEASLDARLVHRTSRSFTLTEAGRDFHEHARAVLIEAEAAEQVVRRRVAEPSGTVRLTASVPTAQLYLAEQLPKLARAYPKLQVHLDVTDRFVDVVQEGYDIAVRSHFAPLPASGLVQRQIASEPIILVAAPGYLAAREPLARPEQLGRHDGLVNAPGSTGWRLLGPEGERVEVSPITVMAANESTVLLGAARAGLGVTCLPESMCRAAVRSGELVRVLPEWKAGTVTTTLLMPHRRGQLPGVRATVEFLVESLAQKARALSP